MKHLSVTWCELLKNKAYALGFDLVGIANAEKSDGFPHLLHWLENGYAGSMDYMVKHAQARRHPESILPEVRSVVMVAMNYFASDPNPNPHQPIGRIARYARGTDYHEILRDRLNALLGWLRSEQPGVQGRGVVDTAPLLERDFARRAGLGWFGKNTMLLNKKLGSFFVLGALLLDVELQADAPFTPNHCGTCTRCLEACPTDAFVAPYQLDARKCISYQTIELRGSIPEDQRAGIGDWLFGCDVCQNVCPWNRKTPLGADPELMAPVAGLWVDLNELLKLSDAEFRTRFRHTPLFRTKRQGVLRNAAIVAGNLGDVRTIPALQSLALDDDQVLREAALWAIERIESKRQIAPTPEALAPPGSPPLPTEQ